MSALFTSASPSFGVSIAGISVCGPVRPENQDYIKWWQDERHKATFAVLADGMGGHKGGALASQLCAEHIQKICFQELASVPDNALDSQRLEELVVKAAEAANTILREARTTEPEHEKMGTTIVLVAILGKEASLLHCGDSRCYILRAPNNAHQQLTVDHTVVQSMLDEGLVEAADIVHIPYRNMLKHAVGIEDKLHYSLTRIQLNDADTLVLCSDGFYEAFNFDGLLDKQVKNNLQNVSEALVEASIASGSTDNSSVILIQQTQEN